MKISFVLISIVNIFCFIGCETIPDGEPPENHIVDISKPLRKYTEKAAVNYLVTSFEMQALPKILRRGEEPLFFPEYKHSEPYSCVLLKKFSDEIDSSYITKKENAEFLIFSRYDAQENIWKIWISSARSAELIWHEKLKLKIKNCH